MKNIKIFAFLAVFLLSAAVSTAWAVDVTLTYKISVTGTIPHAYITNADGKTVCDWRNGIKTLWPANEEHSMNDGYGITFTPDQDLDKTDKNENKKSTSTTAFRTEENTIFTVSVGQGFYFKSVTFKEDDVEKASSSNIAPNSTSISVSVPKNKFFNYITVVLTNDFHYIDENGKEQIRKPGEYTVLTSLTDVSNLGGGWYVVQGEVSYGNSVNFSGDAHLILADGATLEIETEGIYGIYASNNLTIYGQNGQSGTLKVTATGTGGYGIYSYSGDITINGGSVTATGKEYGIYSRGGNITLGWTNSTDFIKVSSIHLGVDSCTVSIAEGKSFKDEDGNVYSGMLTGEQLSAIKSKKLEPCYAVTFDAQNGDDPIMLLTTFDENGVAHVKKPNDPIRSGFTFEGWFTAKDGNTEFDFTKAVTENTTAYAHWNENTPVEYIDENGGTKKTQNYILLTNGINVDNLPGGWYVVEGEVKYTSQVTFNGDAHLILADDATIEIKSEDFGIYANENLTIYGQGGQSGTLNVTALDEIGGTSSSSTGVFSAGNITINGGSVTATSTNGVGIYSDNGVTISGGSVTAYGYYDGIYSYNGGVTISGGSVTATGNYNGIYNDKGNITLGWTNSTDFIKVSSIHLGVDSCTVSIAEGKSFKDEKGNVYSGPLTGEQLSAIEGKKLEPCYAVALDLQDGKAPVMLPATFDENGVAHVEKPADPIRSGFTFEGWFTATDGDTEFDFSAAITGNTTAYAHWTENTPVEYIDENGKTKTVTDYTVLTSSTNVSNLPGGWYVVQGEVKYTSQVKFSGDAHLILADGAEMEIKTEGKYGIDASNNLTIYGQNEQSGILNDTANGTNGIGIFSWSDITISGGKVTATGKNGYGIYGYDGVTISGGSVEATSTYGIYSKETVTISGGKVTASGDNSGINTNAGHITLGWTNSTDFIKVSSIYLGADSCTVSIAEGKSFVDENGNEYRGTLTDENLESIKNKTLTPLMPFPDNIVIANISGATYTGDSIRLEPVVTIGENVLELGKDYTLAYKDNLNASDTAKVIVKGAGKYYGEVQKLFTIDKAPLKITALNDTIVYGDEPASAGVAYEGFVGNETSEVLKGELALEIGYKQYDDVGQYAITPSGLKADNYEIDSVAGTLTVEPKVISIVWGEQTVFAYDGKEHVPTVTAEGFVEGHVARLVVTGAAVEVGNDTAKVALDENDANSKNYKLRTTELEKEFKIVMPIAYIDENGVEQTVTDYTVLTENTSVDNLDGGWYVVEGEVKYTSQVKFSGDAHLILADGATMEIETKGVSEHGIYASNNLTIYGQSKQSDQSDQSGTLKVSATGSGIYSRGNITIIGGSVTATSEYGYGIYSGNITLGWTNSTDYIYASGYYSENGISIAEGKSLRTDEKMLTGMVINNDDINGKTLVPSSFDGKFLSNASIAVADIPVQKYADGKPVCPSVLVTDGKDTLNAGTDYTVTCFNNTAVSSATLDEAAIAQITGKGNYAGAIQKRFFIWNNIRDYAAVQVFEDADGKTHAEIDGAYDGADAVAIDEDVENVAVKFNREFTPNSGFSTIMLPFDIEAKNLTGVKSVIEFAGVVDNNGKNAVGMTYVWCNATLGEEELEKGHTNCNGLQGELKAYTPYMIEMESATLGINGGVTLKATVTPEARVDDWVFRGTLAMHEWTSEEMKNTKIWGFAAQQQGDFKIGEFVPFGAGAWILPFRAFMEYDPDGNKGSSGAPVPKGELGPTVASIDLPETMEVVIVSREGGEEHTTVIGRLNTRTGEIRLNNVGRRTFDLKGRSVGKPKAKGIYLKK